MNNNQYINKINLLTEWLPTVNSLYFSFKNNVGAIQSEIVRWNLLSQQDKDKIVEAIFTVRISPFFGCHSRYKSSPPPCFRRRYNGNLGYLDCQSGSMDEIELSCRQANSPEYCKKIFMPYVKNNFSCNDERRKSIDGFVIWLYNSLSSKSNIYMSYDQMRYLADSAEVQNRWK
jgi:hypothetical protein